MTARFRLADLVDLGDGWARLPVPGEHLYRIIVAGCPYYRWMPEEALAETELYGLPCEVESIVVPGPPPSKSEPAGTSLEDAPDPRQLELPIADPVVG